MLRSAVAVAVVAVVVVAVVSFGAGCPRKAAGAPDAGAAAGRDDTVTDDGIKAVLQDDGPPHPQAVRACRALVGSVAERRATCCDGGGGGGGGQSAIEPACRSALSALLKGKSASIDEARLASCETAQRQALEGCAWVRPLAPLPPESCGGLVTGTLEENGRCRSSLECKEGLRCLGASPLDTGRCGKPGGRGAPCGGAVDAASVALPQSDIDRAHPECADGLCVLGRCQPFKAKGDGCRSPAECGAGNRCDAGVCVPGLIAVGQPCTAGGCVDGARCRAGTCIALSSTGGACESDFDCAAGGCVKPEGAAAGAAGTCGMRCQSYRDIVGGSPTSTARPGPPTPAKAEDTKPKRPAP